jgi:methyl-accepting chemotaxis protein-2 (aspartate sensor receptor)
MIASSAFSSDARRLSRLAATLRHSLPSRIELDTAHTVEVVGRDTPTLRAGAAVLNLDNATPDRFTAQTGATATIFVKSDQDFVRIATSVKKADGERAIGTSLSHAHPGYAQLQAGRPYVGYATLFGTQYLTQYDPMTDASGRIIGALYVGIDVSRERRLSLATKLAWICFALTSLLVWLLLANFSNDASDAASERFVTFLSLGLIGCGLISAILYGFMRRAIGRPLQAARALAQRLASGDLTEQLAVDSNDDIGQVMQAINGIAQGLTDIVGNVRNGSQLITTASSEIAAGNADLSARTSEQAASLEETAASMSRLIETVRLNADNARDADRLVLASSAIAAKGGEVVDQVVRMMASMKLSAEEISRIVVEIEDIAFQTNILALNAAVEAARAGEHGRSFAVVAGDVRNLAQRSGNAAKQIKTLIGQSVTRADAGTELADQAGKTMADIVNSVKRVTDIMAQISTASIEQSTGIEQVNVAIARMDQMTQQNAALVEEAAAAAESLHMQAEALSKAVATFRLP